MTRLRNAAVIRPNSVLVTSRPATDEPGERTNAQLGQYALSKPPGQPHRWTGEQSLRPFGAFPLVDGSFCGAGGNRTPVHQAASARATTIPVISPDAGAPAGRLAVTSGGGGPRIVFPIGHQSLLTSAVFPAAIPRFCCRAAVDRPRAPLLVTMSLRSPEDQAARANCSLAILVVAPFSESEQLGSHVRPMKLMSKPVSPVG